MFVTILKKYIWVFNLVLLTALAYVAALTVNHKIEGMVTSPGAIASQKFTQSTVSSSDETNAKHPLSYYNVIMTRNIFGIESLTGDASPASHDHEALPDSTLNIVLLGTIINPNSSSVAIIKNPDNSKVDGYRNGQQVDIIKSENVKLIEVMNCKAVIERQKTGRETIKCLSLGDKSTSAVADRSSHRRTRTATSSNRRRGRASEEDNGISKVGDNEYEVSREMLEEVLSDPSEIIQQARVIPQSDGLRFFGIRSNSIFWKIGIKNGDTLHRINNVELNDVEKALGIFEELRSQSYFTIDFTRAGKQYTYQYTVK
jgi:general secretion pathway protein C